MNTQLDDYQTFIEPYRHQMVNTIWRVVRNADDVMDVLQDALEQIVKTMATIRKHPHPRALIIRICINKAYDHLRRSSRRHRLTNRIYHEGTPLRFEIAPDEKLDQQTRLEEVLAGISKLPKREAEALLLYTLEGLSLTETAKAMNCRESSIRSMISKARKRLEKMVNIQIREVLSHE